MAMQLSTQHDDRKASLLAPTSSEAASQVVSTRAVHRMGDPTDLVALATYVQQADDFTRATVGSKLDLITQQIQFLQNQARGILEEAKRDVSLTHAKCNFKRIPGKIYHLYKRAEPQQGEETEYFSMLSPTEWNGRLKDEYLGSYRLEPDRSWTPLDKVAERDARYQFNPQMLGIDRGEAEKLAIKMS
eukprot:TRINITY_DN10052_c0_g1_i1.p1 TRINITY_DN10052_c0_g1~~TRINITY_DN10052_c0_g1_i1.p1  ORF type:complete len:188 (+),score=32.27 TRINITY_DN10052_c0_g1_i1:189-752(+)